ncbi:MAG: Crp/Fnr family transcriptional regulator [Anaerovorax sp.]
MDKVFIDDGISKESIRQMIGCLQPQFKRFRAKETILCYSDKIEKLGILISGTAHLYSLNLDGEYSLLEKYDKKDVFGSLFCLPLENFEYIIHAITDCEVMFVDYHHIITPCSNVCAHHSQLLNNLFHMTAQKARTLALHINILSQHTTRKKLITYLKYIHSLSGSDSFLIPMSLLSLSEYLCVDRSAMMRELRLLKQEGFLQSNGRTFSFLKESCPVKNNLKE